jgi:hypothetical protein
VWRTFSNQYKENLKRIWDEETLGQYKTVRRVKKDHWFESSFCLVMASLQFKTTIIVYTDFSERKIRSVMTRRRTRIGGEGEKEFDPQARMDTQAYIFHNDRVFIKLEEKIKFPFQDAICIYYNRNHFEYVKLLDNIQTSEVRFTGFETPRQDVMMERDIETRNENNIDPTGTAASSAVDTLACSLKDDGSYATPSYSLDKIFHREVRKIGDTFGLKICTPLSDIGYFAWDPENAPYQALGSITSKEQILRFIEFDGKPDSIHFPESETVHFKAWSHQRSSIILSLTAREKLLEFMWLCR